MFVLALIGASVMAACALDAEPEEGEGVVDPIAEESSLDPDGEESSGAEVSHDGCSIVVWCDDPNSGDRTVCRQRGCSEGAAKDECKREASIVCGAPRCPFVFYHLGGRREVLLQTCPQLDSPDAEQ